ncbi:transcriptional regulator [Alcanivorax balearicus MACL04]|uniref:Transcriptional regulator n=1 Tax=Alloalcanivorax balearicus MACL04 TaxID=1177182 RepID=A0ABT2R5D6_9GAMM|nr:MULTISPECIES: addiction module antidote protein [Alcanivoracaceae]KYZ87440.1 addiction module antitoxin [Alcanivorax sp. KX64203]MCU5784975.1 transcriptional regulator [Alloalcanivorax balearicus MACL04]
MTEHKLKPWDASDHLEDREDMILYLNACIEEDPGDGSLIRAALSDIARAQNMSRLADETGMTRAGLYKALSPEGNPGFDTMLKITRALGLSLHFDQHAH